MPALAMMASAAPLYAGEWVGLGAACGPLLSHCLTVSRVLSGWRVDANHRFLL